MPANNRDSQILCEKQKEIMINLTATAGMKSEKAVCNARPWNFTLDKPHSFILVFSSFRRAWNKGIHLSSEVTQIQMV